MANQKFTNFSDFYAFYLTQHQNPFSRFLHVIGSMCAVVFLLIALIAHVWIFIVPALVCGYGFAWLGHFLFERNKPATFKQPFYSLLADFVMLKDILLNKLPSKK